MVFDTSCNIMKTNKIILHQIIVAGGLSVLDGLCQRLADLSGLPVSRPRQFESTSKGLAFLISGRGQPWQAEEANNLKSDSFKPVSNETLAQRYRSWRKELDKELRKMESVHG